MKIYLASRYSRHDEMVKVAQILEDHGHQITSRWIYGSHELDPDRQAQAEQFAIEDVEDLTKADAVISFTEDGSVKKRPSKGGRHVEFGLGLGLNKMLVVIGPREHVFHYLPVVDRYDTLDEWLAVVGGEL